MFPFPSKYSFLLKVLLLDIPLVIHIIPLMLVFRLAIQAHRHNKLRNLRQHHIQLLILLIRSISSTCNNNRWGRCLIHF